MGSRPSGGRLWSATRGRSRERTLALDHRVGMNASNDNGRHRLQTGAALEQRSVLRVLRVRASGIWAPIQRGVSLGLPVL